MIYENCLKCQNQNQRLFSQEKTNQHCCPICGFKQNLKFQPFQKNIFGRNLTFQFELFFKKSMEPLAPFWNEFFNNPIAR
jgi:hypothetical protein